MKSRPPIYTKYYDLLGWVLDRVAKFPKHTRFGLVQKIEGIALLNLDLLIEALYRKDRHVLYEPLNIGLEKLRRLIKCRPTLELTDRIIEGWRSTDDGPAWFAGDDLLTAAERPRGLPIGALTSQLFANLFLNRIDHAIEEECRPAGYARYTDDLLVFGNDKRRLGAIRERLFVEFAAERLKPHPTKCRGHACREGVPFLGFRYWPDRVRVLRANRIRFEKRMSRLRRATRKDRSRLREVWPAMFGWFQFAREYGVNEGLVRAQCRHQVFG